MTGGGFELAGSNFAYGMKVYFDATLCTDWFGWSTYVRGSVPSMTAGEVTITVETAAGTSNGVTFTVT